MDSEFCPAGAAHYRGLIPLLYGPDLNRMVFKGIVAIFAGIVLPTALHLDGNDIDRRVVMSTARLRIQLNAEYVWSRLVHGYRVEEFRGKADHRSRIWKV